MPTEETKCPQGDTERLQRHIKRETVRHLVTDYLNDLNPDIF